MKRLRGPMILARGNQFSANNSFEAKPFAMTPKKNKLPHSSFGEYNDPETEEKEDFYKAPSRQSEPRHKQSFDLNSVSPVRNQSTTVPFDEIKIQPRERYPLEE